jgi:coenzyme F420-reducing hydrogenase alpha subunit
MVVNKTIPRRFEFLARIPPRALTYINTDQRFVPIVFRSTSKWSGKASFHSWTSGKPQLTTIAWPTREQHIRLDAVTIDGRLVAKRLATTRASGITGALAAQPVRDVPQLLSRLFSLCGTAHAVAGLAAIEAALGIEVSPAQLVFRELMLLAEHGAALGWRILMDWPPLLGDSPEVRACADIRRAATAVSTIAEHSAWARIGGARLRPDRGNLRQSMSELARMLVELFPEAADPALTWSNLESSLQGGTSIPARLINVARTGVLADYGHHDRPLLPSMDATWFAARLTTEPRFGDAPTLDGTPAEVGPLAAQRHPLVADAVAHWGATLATRLLAAALDAPVVAGRLCRALDGLANDDPIEFDATRLGRGAGVVETARGPLAYVVEAADGRVRMLCSVAPTEWNFHPNGPFVAALDAAPRVPDPVLAARLLAASFDPCVQFRIEASPDHRSPTNEEIALHA